MKQAVHKTGKPLTTGSTSLLDTVCAARHWLPLAWLERAVSRRRGTMTISSYGASCAKHTSIVSKPPEDACTASIDGIQHGTICVSGKPPVVTHTARHRTPALFDNCKI